MKVYRLSVPNHDGPSLLIERTADELREALLTWWAELCPNGRDSTPEVPEDGIALFIEPDNVTERKWLEASEFEWEGFLP